MKYQAQIRHINGDVLTTIQDNKKERFDAEINKANENISKYIECPELDNNDLFIIEV